MYSHLSYIHHASTRTRRRAGLCEASISAEDRQERFGNFPDGASCRSPPRRHPPLACARGENALLGGRGEEGKGVFTTQEASREGIGRVGRMGREGREEKRKFRREGNEKVGREEKEKVKVGREGEEKRG